MEASYYDLSRLPNVKVSIVIPTLKRTDKLLRLLRLIGENSAWPNREVVVVHSGEPILDSYPIPVTAIRNDGLTTAPGSTKVGVDASDGDLVMFLGNDCEPRPGFLYEAVAAMYDAFGPEMDGLVGLNDGYWVGGVLATHWLASKALLPMLGGEFFHTGYHHVACDTELTERCRKIGKYVWAPNSHVFHDHPVQTGFKVEDMDEVYVKAYDRGNMLEDGKTLRRRAAELGFRIPGAFHRPDPKDINLPPRPYHPKVNLAARLSGLDFRRIRAVNFGMGSGASDLAMQLPGIPFARLDGVDVHQPYLDIAYFAPWKARTVNLEIGDIREFDRFGQFDLVLAFDVLEHLEKAESLAVLDRIEKSGIRAAVFLPLEREFRPNVFGAESQDHKSLWTESDFSSRGWRTDLLPGFHGDFDALWAFLRM